MFYRNKDNNQHIYIYIIKKHDPTYINKSNIYNISHAYEKLSTHLTRKQTALKRDIFKNDSKEHISYLIHLTKDLFHNPICF